MNVPHMSRRGDFNGKRKTSRVSGLRQPSQPEEGCPKNKDHGNQKNKAMQGLREKVYTQTSKASRADTA